jgi:uncharacterized protein YegP (UPF0339 family)
MRKFEVKQTESGFHFVLKANNNEVILSSESYTSKQAAVNGIDSVKENANHYSAYDLRKSSDNKYYFVLVAKNNEIIGVSETYNSKSSMLNGIDSVMENAKDAPVYFIGTDPYKEEE